MINQMMQGKIQNLMNQLQQRNPQMFQMLEQVKQNDSNPIDLLKQVTGNYTPQQMQNFYMIAQNMGFPNEVLSEIQNQMK